MCLISNIVNVIMKLFRLLTLLRRKYVLKFYGKIPPIIKASIQLNKK